MNKYWIVEKVYDDFDEGICVGISKGELAFCNWWENTVKFADKQSAEDFMEICKRSKLYCPHPNRFLTAEIDPAAIAAEEERVKRVYG